jgi:hypothetical protein
MSKEGARNLSLNLAGTRARSWGKILVGTSLELDPKRE